MDKRHTKLILVLVLLLSFISSIALGEASSKERIYDFANLLSREEKEDLEKLSKKYSTRRNTDFIILTISDPMGKDIVEYMEDFYDEEGLGYDKVHGNTAILTLDMENRDVYLAGFYKAKEYLDGSRLDIIRDKITPDLSSGEYYNAFNKFIKTSNRYMKIRPGVNPENILFKLWFQLLISLGIAGISVGAMVYSSGGRMTVSGRTYEDTTNSKIISRRDTYLRTDVRKRRKPSDNNSGSGGGNFRGGGGGGGTSRGGHSHSGSRGKF